MSNNADIGAPGVIEVIELVAEKFDGGRKVDIKSIFASIEISTSLSTPTIYGVISLIDNSNLLNNETFTFNGEEFITIAFKRQNTDKTFRYKFVVSTMNMEIKTLSADSSMFVLTLLSVDTFVNSGLFKSKGYGGSITDIIKQILSTELKSEIRINEERFANTEIQSNYAFTEIKPFEKISIIVPRAFKETEYATNMYMFYETLNGYNFESLNDIIDRGKANTNIMSYSHTPLTSIDREININSILKYNPIGTFDNHRRMFHGFYNTKVIKFDFYNKTVANTQYNSILDARKPSLNGRSDPGVSNTFSSTVKNLGSLTYFIPWDSSINDKTGETLLNNSPFSILMEEGSLEIKTFGNLEYDLGDPLNISILDNRSLQDNDKKNDPRYSGKYIIHAITYTIGVNQYGYSMFNNMKLIRDGALIDGRFYNDQYTTGGIKIPAIGDR